MRILLVSRGFPPRGRWGTEFYTHQLARGLRARGHEIAVLHAVRDGSRERGALEEHESDGFRVFVVHNAPDPKKPLADSYSNPEVERAFDRLLERWRAELVHFNYLLWGLSARLPSVARARGLPSIVTLTDFGLLCHRGQMFDWRLRDCRGPHPADVCARCIREPSPFDAEPARLLAKRFAVRGASLVGGLGRLVSERDVAERERAIEQTVRDVDRFIAPTRALAEVFARSLVPREKLDELVYSFDETAYVAARAEPKGEIVRIAFLGQYAPHKGPHVLLDAARIMAHRLPESVEPWRIELYGDPSGVRHRAFGARAMLAPSERVSIHDSIEHARVPELLAGVSAVVVPSLWIENAPFAALEARSAGVPVIASDVAGLAEVIEPGVHGVTFPAGDALALADRLREVVLRRVARSKKPGLALPFDEHLARVETIYAGAAPRRVASGA
jgi:glycosyltransferase involved in cell wall biosynthesis